ncbi:scamp family-domain-containing protein [Pisolithus croceorrhizus]|nr:scamp family-domain-containing protein [Pisolithus croceorrhizus]KAI6132195.1 scamp family-domain-containing protein [Pisolithus croceorrhizus]KAI6160038.1 scamp family-domain-containing protein [Pisolithus thermaeus]
MADYNQNPFASTHSLDANPFDDPAPIQGKTARQRDLEQRERDLERREQELNQRAEHIRRHGRNNWPPFFPLIFHSIPEEIPEASRPLISRLYQLWLVLLATLIVNMIACIFFLVAGSSDGGKDLGGSIGYLLIISPLSFLLWYRPIYNGYMKEQALYYYIFFFFCGFHLLYSIYMVIGIPSTGSAGLIQTIQMYASGHWAAGILGTVATVGWSVQGLGLAYYYRQIWSHHTTAGHTVDKAKAELASHGAKAYFTRG